MARITYDVAVDRLDAAGFRNVALALHNWRAENGTRQGWDGWFRGAYPQLVTIVWP